MMRHVLRRSAVVVLLAAFAACAGHGAASAAPRPIGNDHPDFAYGERPLTEMRADVSVMVDADGHPDMSTLRITGIATVDQRAAITEWIARTVFDPAKHDAAPVRAEYRTSVRSKIVTRPVAR